MPELPEVETIARTLSPQVVGRTLLAAHVLHAKTLEAGKKLFTGVFPGARITRVWRRGKLLLLDLQAPVAKSGSKNTPPDFLMVFHLKMTGRLFVHAADVKPHKHTRMVFDLAATTTLPAARLFFDDVRTFGYCRLMRPEELEHWPFWQKLGPEPLSLAPAAFAAAFSPRRGKIKALLLDQTMIAGVGNIYADEACFRSGIRPDAPASAISPEKLATLLASLQEVLRESIDQCGSSIRDYRDANGDAGAFQNLFRVYGRAGQPCVVCGDTLQRATVAGRTTVFCSHCQK